MTADELYKLALDAHITVYQVKRGKVKEEEVKALIARLADLGAAVTAYLDKEVSSGRRLR